MTTRGRDLEYADSLVQRTIDIIKYLNPPMWWIENPRHGLLSKREVVFGLPHVDIDYCRFSTWGYQKPTRFFCSKNIAMRGNVKCEGKCANLVRTHNGKFRHAFCIGNKFRQEPPDRHNQVLKIPENVVHYLTGFIDVPLTLHPLPEKSEWNFVGPHGKITPEIVETQFVQEVQVRPWHHHNNRPFRLGRVEHRGGALQLMVEVQISVKGSTPRSIMALIDTGAQTNLLKGNIFHDDFWTTTKKPLALTTVNGENLPGGKREVNAQITFLVDPESGKKRSENSVEISVNDNDINTWTTDVWFYDGDISCDAILGYSWLAQKRLNVQPWRDTLQLHDPPHFTLLSKPLPQKKIKTCRSFVDGWHPLSKFTSVH